MLNFKCMRCKYSFADEQLPISPLEQIKQQRTARPTLAEKPLSEEEEISKILTEILKNVKCPQCQSTVYLTGIGEIKGFEIDLSSEPLVQLIKGAVDLVKNEKGKDISKEYTDYASAIASILIRNPGKLVYFADPDFMKNAKSALDIIWDNVNTDELFDEMTHSGDMVYIIGGYIDRAKKLKPTLLSVKPDNLISVSFQSAIECWLFELNSASLILCCSIIEKLLEQKYPTLLYKTEKSLKSFEELKALKDTRRTLEEFIDVLSEKGFIDENTRKVCQDIRQSRNKAVHKLRSVSSDESYTAITNTKKVIEQLLK